MIRHGWIGVHTHLTQKRQCVLAGVSRTTVYARRKPEVFNSDQGSQFTSEAYRDFLKRECITISMDGRGRAYDNIFLERLWRSVKHEDVYLNGYATMGELLIGLTKYFAFYNAERSHQSLGNQTPQEINKLQAAVVR